jgi:hypothetical protein
MLIIPQIDIELWGVCRMEEKEDGEDGDMRKGQDVEKK